MASPKVTLFTGGLSLLGSAGLINFLGMIGTPKLMVTNTVSSIVSSVTSPKTEEPTVVKLTQGTTRKNGSLSKENEWKAKMNLGSRMGDSRQIWNGFKSIFSGFSFSFSPLGFY